MLRNTERVLAVEMLTAAQALDFRAPLKPGRGVHIAHAAVRSKIEHATKDYEVGADIEQCAGLLFEPDWMNAIESEVGTLD